MIHIVHPNMRARFDDLYAAAKVRTTFVMAMDSVSEHLHGLRKCELFFDDSARADRELFNLPTLMLAVENSHNAVVIRHPELNWLDLSEATLEDLIRLQRGMLHTSMFSNAEQLSQPAEKVEPARPTLNSVLGRAFGLFLDKVEENRKR